jgi:hypothetical protein
MKTDGVFGGPITQALIQDPSLRVLWSRDRPASRKKNSKIRFRACLKSCPLILTPGKKTSYKTKRWLSAVTKSGWHWTQSIPTSSSSGVYFGSSSAVRKSQYTAPFLPKKRHQPEPFFRLF